MTAAQAAAGTAKAQKGKTYSYWSRGDIAKVATIVGLFCTAVGGCLGFQARGAAERQCIRQSGAVHDAGPKDAVANIIYRTSVESCAQRYGF